MHRATFNMIRRSFTKKTTALPLMLIIAVLSVSNCGILRNVQTGLEDDNTLEHDPGKLVGKYYEVYRNTKFVGAKDFQTLTSLYEEGKEKGMSAEGMNKTAGNWRKEVAEKGLTADRVNVFRESEVGQFTQKYVNLGIANLNEGANSEDEKVRLVFQVVDFRKPTSGNVKTYVKIKVLNKKYFDTIWWIPGWELSKYANRRDS